MAKNSIRDFSATAGSNTDIQSVNIDENCPASGINNAIRELMVDLKNVSTGAVNLETPAADSLTVANDLTVDTNTLKVDSSNNRVGIGTASPGAGLTLEGTKDSLASQLKVTASGVVSQYLGGGDNVGLALGHDHASLPIVFKTGVTSGTGVTGSGTEVMRITGTGKIGIGTETPTFSAGGGVHAKGSSGAFTSFRASVDTNTGVDFAADSAGNGYVFVRDNAPLILGANNSERVRITTNGINSATVAANTTVSSANLFISGGFNFQKSTSSRRYKTDITDATHGLSDVLNLRSVTYKGVNDGETIFGGLIAEEIHDAGLTEFVNYSQDDAGNDIPEGVHYGHMVALAFKAIQELKTELDAEKAKIGTLKTEMTALKARVTALEA